MIKTILILFAFLLISTYSFSQKYCDLELSYTTPPNGAIIPIGDTAPVVVKIKNLGPDVITLNDTIKYIWSINSSNHTIVGNIAVGEFLLDTFLHVWPDNVPENDTFSFCNYLKAGQHIGFNDTLQENDTTCISFILEGNGGLGVTDQLQGVRKVFPFPNPTSKMISINLPDNFGARYELIVNDINGKSILRKSNSLPSYKNHTITCDISSLESGIYLVSIKSEKSIVIGKFLKQ
jgi:hypothetical protein